LAAGEKKVSTLLGVGGDEVSGPWSRKKSGVDVRTPSLFSGGKWGYTYLS